MKRNQREQVVGTPRGSQVHTNLEVNKGGLRHSKWVSQREHMVGPSRRSQFHLLPVVGSDCEWASRESNKMKTVGLSVKTKLAQPGLGYTQLLEAIFSSPNTCVMGESSTTTAEASSDKPKSPTPTEKVADRQAESLTSFDSLMVGRTEAVCSYLDGFISDSLVVPQMPQMVVGNGSFCLGVAPMEIGCSSYDGFSSDGHIVTSMVSDRAGVSFGDSIMLQGKADCVAMPISMGFFLAATLLRMMGAGLVDNGVYGVDKARSGNGVHLSQGVDDKCTRQIVVFEND